MFTLITDSCVMDPIVQTIDETRALEIVESWLNDIAREVGFGSATFVRGELDHASYEPAENYRYDESYSIRKA